MFRSRENLKIQWERFITPFFSPFFLPPLLFARFWGKKNQFRKHVMKPHFGTASFRPSFRPSFCPFYLNAERRPPTTPPTCPGRRTAYARSAVRGHSLLTPHASPSHFPPQRPHPSPPPPRVGIASCIAKKVTIVVVVDSKGDVGND